MRGLRVLMVISVVLFCCNLHCMKKIESGVLDPIMALIIEKAPDWNVKDFDEFLLCVRNKKETQKIGKKIVKNIAKFLILYTGKKQKDYLEKGCSFISKFVGYMAESNIKLSMKARDIGFLKLLLKNYQDRECVNDEGSFSI